MIIKLVLILALLAFLYKFFLRPLYYMSLYAKNKGVFKITFIPFQGPFASLTTDLKKYGDAFYSSKIAYEVFPNPRAIAFNIADRAGITLLDPELIKDFYLNQEGNYVKYDLTFKNRARIFGNGVAFAEGNEWKRRRAIATSLMHFEFFEVILPKLQQTVQKMVSQFDFKNGKATFDALEFSSRIAGQAIVKCFFGTDLHNMEFHGQPIVTAMSKFVSEVGDLDRELLVFIFGVGILKLGVTKKHRTINKKIVEIRAFGKQIVESKIKSADTDKEMNFIKYIKEKGYLDSDKETHLTSSELLDEFFTFFIGGMDTTAHLLHMCLYYMSIYPEYQQRLRDQIKDAKENMSIPELSKLTFMDHFINETNRHYGFMTSFFPREAIKDHMLGDIKVYKGTILTMGWLCNFYNKQFFPEPTTFNPDRWNQPLDSPYIFIPFSAGKRTCIGKNLALIQIKLVLIKILKEFRLSSDPNYKLRFTFRTLYEPEERIILQATKL